MQKFGSVKFMRTMCFNKTAIQKIVEIAKNLKVKIKIAVAKIIIKTLIKILISKIKTIILNRKITTNIFFVYTKKNRNDEKKLIFISNMKKQIT